MILALLILVSLILVTLAGLYSYSILNQRGGLLRQLIVAVPFGLLLGAFFYVVDMQMGFLTARMLHDMFGQQIPATMPR